MIIEAVVPAQIRYESARRTVREAVSDFLESHPGTSILTIETIDGRAVDGVCDVCGLPIFSDEEHEQDADGVSWHTEHRTGADI